MIGEDLYRFLTLRRYDQEDRERERIGRARLLVRPRSFSGLGLAVAATNAGLLAITDAFACSDDCPRCLGDGIVCEDHPDQAWHRGAGSHCGAAGMPCNPERRQG